MGIGQDIELHGIRFQVNAFDGGAVVLSAAGSAPAMIKIGALYADPSLKILDQPKVRRRCTGSSPLFDSLPPAVQDRARWLEGHITEALDGVALTEDAERPPRSEYSITVHSLRQREKSKCAELKLLSEEIGLSTFQRLRNAYEREGIIGLTDQRMVRGTPLRGQTDPRVVEALQTVLERNVHESSGTLDRLIHQVRHQLEEEHGVGACPFRPGPPFIAW
ncbi:hypothetical protein DQ353_19280 [Arthrobacter sp. AQ5-05]|nr:hypothetical protein DQ353_19280 [Arthrobacter sp. AQ5-05]